MFKKCILSIFSEGHIFADMIPSTTATVVGRQGLQTGRTASRNFPDLLGKIEFGQETRNYFFFSA